MDYHFGPIINSLPVEFVMFITATTKARWTSCTPLQYHPNVEPQLYKFYANANAEVCA
jgi:hypothetical protein